MLHIVPILCLVFFIGFIEFKLKKEFEEIRREFIELKKKINKNSYNIERVSKGCYPDKQCNI